MIKYLFKQNHKSFYISFIILSIIITSVTSETTGDFSQVIEGFNWGPGVTKMILHLNTEINYSSNEIAPSIFSVITTKEGSENNENRVINKVYISDEKGNKINQNSNYITLEVSCHPASSITNPFYYNPTKSLNNWADPYDSTIQLLSDFVSGTTSIPQNSLNIDVKSKKNYLNGIDNVFTLNQPFTYNDIKLNYAYYKSSDSNNRGVVIWLHGTGEGGTDTTVSLYGNKVTNLASKTIQDELNDCDILVVQCPSRWLNYTTGNVEDSINTIDKYKSIYTEALYNLIKDYVSKNKISSNRIYIGGASNGGSMTMNMILNYPDYFAAAYFASEGYADRHITDKQIESIKNIPLWFVYAVGDSANDPAKTTQATYDRLVKVKANNIHLTKYSNGVVDITGKYFQDDGKTPYKYSPHWSWVYLLDNDCKDNNESLFSWLGNQKKNNNDNDDNQENTITVNDDNNESINNIKINSWIIFLIILL